MFIQSEPRTGYVNEVWKKYVQYADSRHIQNTKSWSVPNITWEDNFLFKQWPFPYAFLTNTVPESMH